MPEFAATTADIAAALLGGRRALEHSLAGPMDIHAMILGGVPGRALLTLIDNVDLIRNEAGLEKAVGISLRTVQRKRAGARDTKLSIEQGGRTWKFAEILARATRIFGAQAAAEAWLDTPAMGLDQQRPLDFLATPAGVTMVETLLEQIEYGIYA